MTFFFMYVFAFLFVYFTQSHIPFQTSSPAKVLQFFALDGTVHMVDKPPEYCDWIKAHKHHLWSVIDTEFCI